VPKFILSPENIAVRISDITYILPVTEQTTNCQFTCGLSSGKEIVFKYMFKMYKETKQDLLRKIINIRYDILKLINDNEDIKEILPPIKLIKNEK